VPAPAAVPFRLRLARPEDAAVIAVVHRSSMREAMPYLPDLHTPEEDRAWVSQEVLSEQEVWVAELDGQVVGVASLAGAMVTQLYILPGKQGLGIGSALLARAKERRPEGLELYAFQRNTRARAFYERRGFLVVAFGDGSGNEEGEPDVLYRWTPAGRDDSRTVSHLPLA
jgi:GNAT superfamily N-acetyltransferase